MRIAIISFFHAESSLCLAKYLAKTGCSVDYYFVAGLYHTVDYTPGFEYVRASHILGNHRLKKEEVPEMYGYFEGLPVQMFLTRILHHDMYPRFNDFLIRILFKQIRRKNYDAINVVGQYSKVEIAHEVFKDCNLIHSFHELGNHSGPLKPLPIVEKAIRDKSKVILHSKVAYERFMSLVGADEQNTKVIPFGKFETCLLYTKDVKIELPFDEEKPILLFYGYIVPYKGLDILYKSLLLLKDIEDDFNVVVAGSGTDECLKNMEKLPNCHVINKYLSNDEMMQLIKLSSLILLPYRTASQSGIIPTCSLYGKPYLATRVGAFAEMIEDGRNGILVEPNNPTAFANGIRSILESQDLKCALDEGAKNYGINDAFDWNTIAAQTLDFIKK